jgi:hypothetical protein
MSASGQSSTGMNNIADAGTSPVPELFAMIHIITSTSKKNLRVALITTIL